jgi:hypothetical protein
MLSPCQKQTGQLNEPAKLSQQKMHLVAHPVGITGRLITLIYALLKKDYETLSHLAPGAKPPEPILYDPEIHKRHRHGQYQALKVSNAPQSIVQSSNK